jgi:hypothetical protein
MTVKKRKPKTFETWLKGYKNEDSKLGDLAKDMIRAKRDRRLQLLPTITLKESMEMEGACLGAWEAYEEAMDEYRAYKDAFFALSEE